MTGSKPSGRGQAEHLRSAGWICSGDERNTEETVMNELQLEKVVESCGTDILRFCRITTGSRDAGDDLYQDTMLTLLEKRETLDMSQNVKAYALSVALKLWKNRTRKWFRRLQLVPQESLESLTEQGAQPGAEETPEESLLHSDQVRLVRQLVQELPEQYRLPIQLYYSADLSMAAIGQVLKLPENTVKSRLHRAKKIIRSKLEEMDHERTGI